MKRLDLKAALALVSVLMLSLASIAIAQTPTARPTPDPLRGLKRALEEASAPALSTAQENALKQLLADRQAAHHNQQPDAALSAAHNAYNAAIVAGNLEAAKTQAAIIANLQTAHFKQRLEEDATFRVAVLNVLKTNAAQVTALTTKFGNDGLLRILGLVGGPGGFGGPGGPGGHGPGGGPRGFGGPGFAPRSSQENE